MTFALGMLFISLAIQRGIKPWTGTFYSNLCLGVVWVVIALVNGEIAPISQWPRAAIVGLLFLLGQLLTYMAFRFGDVSVATPVFGVKILFVAVLSSITGGSPAPPAIWLSAFAATCGVMLVQWRPRNVVQQHRRHKSTTLTVLLAMAAALSLSGFDILLQNWGVASGTWRFLPIVFVSAALLNCLLIPWIDRLSTLRELGGLRPMLIGCLLMAVQAMGMSVTLASFGDATRVNVVYALRGLWALGLAWWLAKHFEGGEQYLPRTVMLSRAAGALLLTGAVILALL
ncbi:MAG: hypothetical protein RIC55_30315 [Pirellulaceae bacterium]